MAGIPPSRRHVSGVLISSFAVSLSVSGTFGFFSEDLSVSENEDFSSGLTAFGDLLVQYCNTTTASGPSSLLQVVMGAVGRSFGAIQRYHYGFGTIQLAVDRDGGSWSRMGCRQLSPTRLSFLPDGFLEFFGGAAVDGAFFLDGFSRAGSRFRIRNEIGDHRTVPHQEERSCSDGLQAQETGHDIPLGYVHNRQPTMMLQASFRVKKESEKEKEREREVKNEKCKCVAGIFFCGPNVFLLTNSVRCFRRNF